MSDLYLVVEFDAIFNHRVIERATVNRRTGADFDIVADDHGSGLRNLHPFAILGGKAEAVAADNCAGMNDRVTANFHAGVNRNVGIQQRTRANLRAGADNRIGADGYAGTELRRRVNHSGWVHSRRLRRTRVEQGRDTGEAGIGIGMHQARLGRETGIAIRHDERCGCRNRQIGPILRIGKKRDIASSG